MRGAIPPFPQYVFTTWCLIQREIRGCIQKFPDLSPRARTANGTALCHKVQLYRYFVSQSSEFCRHNPFCCVSTSVYCCKRIFRYRLGPETFGYTLLRPHFYLQLLYYLRFEALVATECNEVFSGYQPCQDCLCLHDQSQKSSLHTDVADRPKDFVHVMIVICV
jgi:hypothetical protein